MIHKTLIILYAPGVCVAKIANKEAMDYIASVGPTIKQGAIDEVIPESVIHGFEDQFPLGKDRVSIRPLQCTDDRANVVPGMVFPTQSEAMAYARNNDIVLVYSYRGTLNESGR